MDDDATIVNQVLSGDREAFGILVKRHHRNIFGVCHVLSGNAVDANDLAHQAFVEAYLKLRQVRDPARFGGWLRALAVNICRMWRRKRRREEVALADIERAAADLRPAASSPALAAAMSRLPASHRLVLLLHYFEGMSYREMGAFLNTPQGTIMSRLHRARKALKGVLDDMHDMDESVEQDDRVFRDEVDAEVAVLLDMFPKDGGDRRRLEVVVERSPERVTRWIWKETREDRLHDMARLLARMGHTGAGPVFMAWVGAKDEDRRKQAIIFASLFIAAAPGVAPPRSHGAIMASPPLYGLLNEITGSSQPPLAKVGLLLSLLDAAGNDEDSSLLMAVIRALGAPASDNLTTWFEHLDEPGQLNSTPNRTHALCGFGAPAIVRATHALESGMSNRITMGLAFVENIAKAVRAGKGLEGQAVMEMRRIRSRHTPLTLHHESNGLFQGMVGTVAALATSGSEVFRIPAIKILGLLEQEQHADILCEAIHSETLGIRLAAITSLAQLEKPKYTDIFALAMRSEFPREREAAIHALGRLRCDKAMSLLMEAEAGANPGERQDILAALASSGLEKAVEYVRRLAVDGDKTAQIEFAMHCSSPPRPAPLELTSARLQRLRGDATPLHDIRIDAIFRWVATEDREYGHIEFTKAIATVCEDYAATRRYILEQGLMTRDGASYELTPLGKIVQRVEAFALNGC